MSICKHCLTVGKFLGRFFLGYLVTLGVVFGTQWTYYNYFDSYNLPTITQPIPILNKNHKIAIGETILMRLEITKLDNITPEKNTVNITCNDGNLVTLVTSPSAGTIPVGNYIFTSDSYQLPDKFTIGTYCQFNYINEYRPNPYKQEIVTWSSEPFTIVER